MKWIQDLTQSPTDDRLKIFTVVCSQRKLMTQPVAVFCLFWSYGFMTSHLLQQQTQEETCFAHSVTLTASTQTSSASPPALSLSPSIVPQANQIITEAPNFDLQLGRCNLRVQLLICHVFSVLTQDLWIRRDKDPIGVCYWLEVNLLQRQKKSKNGSLFCSAQCFLSYCK